MGTQIRSRIKIFVVVPVFLLAALKMSAQALVVKNVKPVQKVNARFDFDLSNISDSVREYTVTLEQYLEKQDQWSEIIVDVFNPVTYTSKRVYTIGGKKTETRYFYLAKTPDKIKKDLPGSRCRLKITAYVQKTKERSYSEPFIFK